MINGNVEFGENPYETLIDGKMVLGMYLSAIPSVESESIKR